MELRSLFLYFKKSLSDSFHNFSNSFPHGRRGKIKGLNYGNVNVSQDSSLKVITICCLLWLYVAFLIMKSFTLRCHRLLFS